MVIFALMIGNEEVEYSLPKDPDFHCALVQPRPAVQVELRRDSRFGRWPLKCDHRLRTLEIAEDQLGDGRCCEVCGWPWWVIRASSPD